LQEPEPSCLRTGLANARLPGHEHEGERHRTDPPITILGMGEMKDRMLRSELYIADDPDLATDFGRAQRLLERYNRSSYDEQDERDRILRELLGSCGEGVHVRPTFYCEYGTPVSIGAGTFINFECVMLDVAPITIGAACQIATRVQFLTATHPIDPEPRRIGWEYAEPITLGDNVWLGGGVTVCPGVTIGDDTVVGAGAVVSRDLPAGVVAVGCPARVLREIGEGDRIEVPER
jgi:maltose O-acetyltransferase